MRHRNLLPSDNFSESMSYASYMRQFCANIAHIPGYLTSSAPDTLSSQPSGSDGSFASAGGRRNVSGFKIMTVMRGFTEEADKLLDYMVSPAACA